MTSVFERQDNVLRRLKQAGKQIVGEQPYIIKKTPSREQVVAEYKRKMRRDEKWKKEWHSWKEVSH